MLCYREFSKYTIQYDRIRQPQRKNDKIYLRMYIYIYINNPNIFYWLYLKLFILVYCCCYCFGDFLLLLFWTTTWQHYIYWNLFANFLFIFFHNLLEWPLFTKHLKRWNDQFVADFFLNSKNTICIIHIQYAKSLWVL